MEEKILDILVDLCSEEKLRENLDMELFDSGLLDSIDYTDLILQIEEDFGVYIAPTEFTREEMNTPRKIIEVVKSRI